MFHSKFDMKSIFLIILFTSIFTQIFAQKIQYGPELGITLIPVNKTDVELNTFKLGITGSGYFQYNFNKKFALRLDVGYTKSSKTWVQTDTSSVEEFLSNPMLGFDTSITNLLSQTVDLSVTKTTKGNANFSTLQIPLTFVYSPAKKISFGVGAYYSFVLKVNSRTETTQDIPFLDIAQKMIDQVPFGKAAIEMLYPGYYEPDFKESSSMKNLNRFDYGIIGSVTYKMDNYFYLRLKYSRGLKNYYQTLPNLYEVKSPKHSLTSITVGFSFGEIFQKKPKALF